MPNRINKRSPIKRWMDRARLTMDSGIIILSLLATATAAMLAIRHFRHSANTPQYTAAIVSDKSSINGIPRIVDGDTLEVEGIKIRLFGIDAPEHGQICRDESNNGYDCGAKASEQINDLISGQAVSCLPRTTDRYGRTVAVCSVAGNGIRAIILATKIWLIISGLVFGVAVLNVPRNIERTSALRAK